MTFSSNPLQDAVSGNIPDQISCDPTLETQLQNINMHRKDRHFKYRPQRKMKFNQLFVLCFFLFVIFDGTTSQFFGRNTRRKQQPQRVNPSNNQCYYDNECSTGKCRQLDNIFCGFGSEYIRDQIYSGANIVFESRRRRDGLVFQNLAFSG